MNTALGMCVVSQVIIMRIVANPLLQSARWIVFTIFECALEFVLIIPVVTITSKLQTSLQNKIFTISVFLGRLV